MNFTRFFPNGEFLPIPLVLLRNYPVPNCQNRSSPDASVAVEAPESVGWYEKIFLTDRATDGHFLSSFPRMYLVYFVNYFVSLILFTIFMYS